MPRIPENLKHNVFFLYSSTTSALRGESPDGTGFIVGIPPTTAKNGVHYYAVSCAHVVKDAPVIRLNVRGGGSEAFTTDQTEWELDEDNDIAARPLSLKGQYDGFWIGPNFFMTEEDMVNLDIGIGDDVFMLGLFIDHGGSKVRNEPFARFGSISAGVTDLVRDDGREIPSFVLDMRSRAGFSGSPVFLYRTPHANLNRIIEDRTFSELGFLFFLGINWAGFKEKWKLRGPENAEITAEGISHMGAVTPAWKVLELLMRDTFVKQRKNDEAKWPEALLEQQSAKQLQPYSRKMTGGDEL